MSKTNNTKPRDIDEVVQGPGDLLRRSRQRAALSAEEVYRRIGISARTLEALETNAYEALPAAVFVRGYLRTYCHLLNIRPSPVLACYDEHRRYLVLRDAPPLMVSAPRWPRAVTASVGAALMACSLVTWALYADSRAVTGNAIDSAVASLQVISTERQPASEGSEDYIASLDMHFHGDSWLQVIDANDHILAVDLYRAGAQLTLEGVPPFKITLGHAPGVEISYQGAAIEVTPDPDTLAADITVGR